MAKKKPSIEKLRLHEAACRARALFKFFAKNVMHHPCFLLNATLLKATNDVNVTLLKFYELAAQQEPTRRGSHREHL